jgi:hypothetical protein
VPELRRLLAPAEDQTARFDALTLLWARMSDQRQKLVLDLVHSVAVGELADAEALAALARRLAR